MASTCVQPMVRELVIHEQVAAETIHSVMEDHSPVIMEEGKAQMKIVEAAVILHQVNASVVHAGVHYLRVIHKANVLQDGHLKQAAITAEKAWVAVFKMATRLDLIQIQITTE